MNYNLQQKELSTPLQLGTLALLPKNPVQGLPKHSLQIDTQQDVLGRYAMQTLGVDEAAVSLDDATRFVMADRMDYIGDRSMPSLIYWYPPPVIYHQETSAAHIVIDDQYLEILKRPLHDISFLIFYFERLQEALCTRPSRYERARRWPPQPYDYLPQFLPARVIKGLECYRIRPPWTNHDIATTLQLLGWEEMRAIREEEERLREEEIESWKQEEEERCRQEEGGMRRMRRIKAQNAHRLCGRI